MNKRNMFLLSILSILSFSTLSSAPRENKGSDVEESASKIFVGVSSAAARFTTAVALYENKQYLISDVMPLSGVVPTFFTIFIINEVVTLIRLLLSDTGLNDLLKVQAKSTGAFLISSILVPLVGISLNIKAIWIYLLPLVFSAVIINIPDDILGNVLNIQIAIGTALTVFSITFYLAITGGNIDEFLKKIDLLGIRPQVNNVINLESFDGVESATSVGLGKRLALLEDDTTPLKSFVAKVSEVPTKQPNELAEQLAPSLKTLSDRVDAIESDVKLVTLARKSLAVAASRPTSSVFDYNDPIINRIKNESAEVNKILNTKLPDGKKFYNIITDELSKDEEKKVVTEFVEGKNGLGAFSQSNSDTYSVSPNKSAPTVEFLLKGAPLDGMGTRGAWFESAVLNKVLKRICNEPETVRDVDSKFRSLIKADTRAED